jgi:hypothetical protein
MLNFVMLKVSHTPSKLSVIMLSFVMLKLTHKPSMLSIVMECRSAECRGALQAPEFVS